MNPRGLHQKIMHLISGFLIPETYHLRRWVEMTRPKESTSILVITPFTERHIGKKSDTPRFILCSSGKEAEISRMVGHESSNQGKGYEKIFSHPDYSVYSQKTGEGREVFGNQTGHELLSLARKHLTSLIVGKVMGPEEGENGNELYHVDITLWVKGRLRGSYIAYNQPLHKGVRTATALAYADQRFQKVEEKELPHTKIQIVLIRTLGMPLHRADISLDRLLHDKAYMTKDGVNEGWYLPPVYNLVTFRGLTDFLQKLSSEKIGHSYNKKSETAIYETVSWVEGQGGEAVTLDGPVADLKTLHLDKALEYLARARHLDGSMVARLDPIRGVMKDDMVRSLFTVYALTLYGKKNTAAERLAHTSLMTLQTIMKHASHPYPALAHIYEALAVWHQGKEEEATVIAHSISESVAGTYDPITFSQAARLFFLLGDVSKAQSFLISVHDDYKEKVATGKEVDLAAYAELPALLHMIGSRRGDKEMCAEGTAIAQWYLSFQHENGALYATDRNTYSYVRGTGKIIEALSGIPQLDREKLKKGMMWCARFQYGKENLFYVPDENRALIEGSIRHDYFNTEIWSDAIGHLLIAEVNLSS